MNSKYTICSAWALVLLLTSCSDKSATTAPGATTNQSGRPTIAKDLDPTEQDAIDYAIVLAATQSSLNPIDVPPQLALRFKKYEEGTKYRHTAKKVLNRFPDNGCVSKIEPGAEFTTTFEGTLTAAVSISTGSVGITNGVIFVAEGTRALVNGKNVAYTNGAWKRAEPPVQDEKAK